MRREFLRTGMVVETTNGLVGIVQRDMPFGESYIRPIIYKNNPGLYAPLSVLPIDLSSEETFGSSHLIKKVYLPKYTSVHGSPNLEYDYIVLWQRGVESPSIWFPLISVNYLDSGSVTLKDNSDLLHVFNEEGQWIGTEKATVPCYPYTFEIFFYVGSDKDQCWIITGDLQDLEVKFIKQLARQKYDISYMKGVRSVYTDRGVKIFEEEDRSKQPILKLSEDADVLFGIFIEGSEERDWRKFDPKDEDTLHKIFS